MESRIESSGTEFLKELMSKPIEVKLIDGSIFKGTLLWIDGLLNIALERCDEYLNGTKVDYY